MKDPVDTINQRRQSMGIRTSALAERVGVNYVNLNNYLNRKRRLPCEVMLDIMDVLDMDIDDFREEVTF